MAISAWLPLSFAFCSFRFSGICCEWTIRFELYDKGEPPNDTNTWSLLSAPAQLLANFSGYTSYNDRTSRD
ncbi:hypothetical protein BDV95DRAFT_570899 [Massariosphaeria phaeospora]|uniref:Secreted protein n=1 Tax=Massariosphaeria phaeospora TaxID=100035 RepID=A0A7C8I6E0_9PLEO|nr:hypothetical protein BDV95DRAFT_570899 [Massariosphaeria phaeospora]